MGELVIKNDKLAKTKEAGNTPLDVELFQNKIKSFEQVGNYFSTIVNSYKEIKQNINPEEMYVVKFTQDQLKKFQNGEIDITVIPVDLLKNFENNKEFKIVKNFGLHNYTGVYLR